MRYAQLVIGPAGSGKSTYCTTLQQHCDTVGRRIFVVNLDPAAETFAYECLIDVRELISVNEVFEASQEGSEVIGPNGALLYCMEHLIENIDWLSDRLDESTCDDDYILFDCPGQIELYSHLPLMRRLVDHLQNCNFRMCSTWLVDVAFCLDTSKFVAAALTSLSSMVSLEMPAVNVLTKMDLLSKQDVNFVATMLDGDITDVLLQNSNNDHFNQEASGSSYWEDTFPVQSNNVILNPPAERLTLTNSDGGWSERNRPLTEAIANVLGDYSLVRFLTLDRTDEDSIADLLLSIDSQIQYGEDAEPRDRYPEEFESSADAA